ncbi:MAG: sigma-70 family RNA polymerase sigma factor [Gemmatimonadota bacterium]
MTDLGSLADQDLIVAIRAGDERALETLVASYWDTLLQYAARVLRGAADPQDVVQEAFIRLWTHRERWGSDGSVRSLLYTVTRNVALDELRRDARATRAVQAADRPDPPGPPSDDAEASELRASVRAAVAALPAKRQEVFRLAREEGLSYAEIAAVMGLSPQTVANHMSLALSDLRRALALYLTPSPDPPRDPSGP